MTDLQISDWLFAIVAGISFVMSITIFIMFCIIDISKKFKDD